MLFVEDHVAIFIMVGLVVLACLCFREKALYHLRQ